MVTATATRRRAATTTAVVPVSLTNDELMALLGQANLLPQGGGEFHRMTLKSGVLETDDGEMFPPKKSGPSLTVRITKPPVYYNAFFLSDSGDDGSVDASIIGRSDLNGRFCKKYDDPNEQANDSSPANEVYDDIARMTGKKGNFKADIWVQIVPESGEMTGEETEYVLTLSTTSVFEWRGSTRQPTAGSVSDENFIVKLSQLALKNAVEAGLDKSAQQRAVLDAMTSLRLGGVIAEVYLVRTENPDNKRSWWVISFNPIHIEPLTEQPALTSGDDSGDDVPF